MVKATVSTSQCFVSTSVASSAARRRASSEISPLGPKPKRLNVKGDTSFPARSRTWTSNLDQARDRSVSMMTRGSGALLLIGGILQVAVLGEPDILGPR